jgi:hypothetical protein
VWGRHSRLRATCLADVRPPQCGEWIGEQLTSVFTTIDAAAKQILIGDDYSLDPPAIRLVSGFAEGTDRIAIATCPESWEIESITRKTSSKLRPVVIG